MFRSAILISMPQKNQGETMKVSVTITVEVDVPEFAEAHAIEAKASIVREQVKHDIVESYVVGRRAINTTGLSPFRWV
jgi:hypothetical protein